MSTRVTYCKKPVVLAVMGIALAVSGCQSGNPLSGLGLGGSQTQEPPVQTITAEELLAYCPSVTLSGQDAVHTSFLRGGEGDQDKLVYSASFSDATRSCSFSGDTMNLTVAAAGRVVPGRAGKTGNVQLPVHVTVYQGSQVVYDKTYSYAVPVADTLAAAQFVFTDSAIALPRPTARNMRVVVGFKAGGR